MRRAEHHIQWSTKQIIREWRSDCSGREWERRSQHIGRVRSTLESSTVLDEWETSDGKHASERHPLPVEVALDRGSPSMPAACGAHVVSAQKATERAAATVRPWLAGSTPGFAAVLRHIHIDVEVQVGGSSGLVHSLTGVILDIDWADPNAPGSGGAFKRSAVLPHGSDVEAGVITLLSQATNAAEAQINARTITDAALDEWPVTVLPTAPELMHESVGHVSESAAGKVPVPFLVGPSWLSVSNCCTAGDSMLLARPFDAFGTPGSDVALLTNGTPAVDWGRPAHAYWRAAANRPATIRMANLTVTSERRGRIRTALPPHVEIRSFSRAGFNPRTGLALLESREAHLLTGPTERKRLPTIRIAARPDDLLGAMTGTLGPGVRVPILCRTQAGTVITSVEQPTLVFERLPIRAFTAGAFSPKSRAHVERCAFVSGRAGTCSH